MILVWMIIQATMPEIKVYGALRDVMHKNDISGKVTLNLLGPLEDMVGVGAVEGLEGEITLWGGEAFVSSYTNNRFALDKSTNVSAALLVVSEVREWTEINVDRAFDSIGDFELWLEKYAEDHGITDPFAFRIVTEGKAMWHVITPPKKGEDHKSAAKNYTFEGSFQTVGFFSKTHQGVFTHQGGFTHMHFIDDKKQFSGHLDEFNLQKGITLYLPK